MAMIHEKSDQIEEGGGEEQNVAVAVDTVPEKQFKNFDLLTDVPADHFYLVAAIKPKSKKTKTDSFVTPSSIAYKKIMKEWRILEKDLPDSIYVRAYENRIDLLRAAIIGAAGTPYHDGLFFFDISFPEDYPAKPPKVYYRSFGLQINPNMYSNGYVCLSLLNTWLSLRKGEGWNPKESTILQVLVSIQGMVLNRDPFFNEPGAGLLPGNQKRSIGYSENAFILSCKTMIYLVRKPPNDFNDLVRSHFRNRASHILSACNAYMKGKERLCEYPAYSYKSNNNEDQTHESSYSCSCSAKSISSSSSRFRKAVLAIYPVLLSEFMYAGDSVKSLAEEYNREKMMGRTITVKDKQASAETEAESKKKKRKTGFWNKIKAVFGMKKKTGENKN